MCRARKTGAAGFFQIIAELPAGTTTYTDLGPSAAGLKPGTFYDYHIQASNEAGYSDFTGANTMTPLPMNDVTPPAAVVQTAAAIKSAGGTEYRFIIRYTDASGVDVASLSNADILVTGPGVFSSGVTLLNVWLPPSARRMNALTT